MITSKQHVNKPVVSVTDGKKLGEVKDLYLNQDMRQVTMVMLGKGGLISISLNRKAQTIPVSAVQVFGVDVWLVSGPDIVKGPEDTPEAETFTLVGELRGREIQTEGGTKIGAIEDVVLDNETRVLGFTLGKVYVRGPLADRKVISREAITSLGSKTEPMTIVLAQAESLALP